MTDSERPPTTASALGDWRAASRRRPLPAGDASRPLPAVTAAAEALEAARATADAGKPAQAAANLA